jgi:hypothetical protein
MQKKQQRTRQQDVHALAQVQVHAGRVEGFHGHAVRGDDGQGVRFHTNREIGERAHADQAQAGGPPRGQCHDLVRAARVGRRRGRVGRRPPRRDGQGRRRAGRVDLAAGRAERAVAEKSASVDHYGLGIVYPRPLARRGGRMPSVRVVRVFSAATAAVDDFCRVKRPVQAKLQAGGRPVVPVADHERHVQDGRGRVGQGRQGRVGHLIALPAGRENNQRSVQAVHDRHRVRVHPKGAGPLLHAEAVAHRPAARPHGALVEVGHAIVPGGLGRRRALSVAASIASSAGRHGKAVEMKSKAFFNLRVIRREGVDQGHVQDVAPVQGDRVFGGQEPAVDEEDVADCGEGLCEGCVMVREKSEGG